MFAGQFDARPHNSKLFRDLEKGSASQMQPEQAQTAASILTGPRRVVTINGASSTPPNIRPRRLAWPRTSPFHGGNTGSNPVGDANLINNLRNCRFWRATGYGTVPFLI